ncbi:hypothetical protein CW304_19075 [Bacillus sp. UFRGS-B20]|nr:hypothetical protein CW304_19075 [Bacillus sp. UFRGS-B20]
MQERLFNKKSYKRRRLISLILINGFHMKGIVKEYDAFFYFGRSDKQNQIDL